MTAGMKGSKFLSYILGLENMWMTDDERSQRQGIEASQHSQKFLAPCLGCHLAKPGSYQGGQVPKRDAYVRQRAKARSTRSSGSRDEKWIATRPDKLKCEGLSKEENVVIDEVAKMV
ncbi:hypothetical protein N7G274_001425 [Stereocaulon virgatum]|uniref:Uncharacterized protein n=1 Tax=Stereocaulon virgatum TaxID=373712 RepID=A0ABR4ARY0_9LECA